MRHPRIDKHAHKRASHHQSPSLVSLTLSRVTLTRLSLASASPQPRFASLASPRLPHLTSFTFCFLSPSPRLPHLDSLASSHLPRHTCLASPCLAPSPTRLPACLACFPRLLSSPRLPRESPHLALPRLALLASLLARLASRRLLCLRRLTSSHLTLTAPVSLSCSPHLSSPTSPHLPSLALPPLTPLLHLPGRICLAAPA